MFSPYPQLKNWSYERKKWKIEDEDDEVVKKYRTQQLLTEKSAYDWKVNDKRYQIYSDECAMRRERLVSLRWSASRQLEFESKDTSISKYYERITDLRYWTCGVEYRHKQYMDDDIVYRRIIMPIIINTDDMLTIRSIAPLEISNYEANIHITTIYDDIREYDKSQSNIMMMYKVMMSNGITDKDLVQQQISKLMKSNKTDNMYIRYLKFREKYDAFKEKWTNTPHYNIRVSIIPFLAPCLYLLEILIYMNIRFGIDRYGKKDFLKDDEYTYKKLRTDFIIKAYENDVDIQDAVDVPICDLGAEYTTGTNKCNVFLFLCQYADEID
jgi:hypothetical protein